MDAESPGLVFAFVVRMCGNSPEWAIQDQTVDVRLDGLPIRLPSERKSLNAIRSYLETLALEKQRILCAFTVDGEPADIAISVREKGAFARVEGATVDLSDMPLQLIETAKQQTADARALVEQAVTLVLINDSPLSRELWWKLTRKLKEPLLTLSLLPDTICGMAYSRVSLTQLRKWQLQQLAAIIKSVDEACWSEDMSVLSNALEYRALPWLENLHNSLELWHQTMMAGARAGRRCV